MQEQLTQTNSHLTSQQKTENSELDLSLAGYDYELPTELIAQNPAVPRDSSRLLVVNSLNVGTEIAPQHRIFRDLPEILRPGDLLVMNNTRVIPARLYGEKLTGAEVEVLLLEERQHNLWLALVKPGKRFKHGSKIVFTAKDGREDREKEDAGTRGRGDAGTRGRGDAGTQGHGDAGTRGHGDAGTRGQGDAGTRGRGDKGTRGQGGQGGQGGHGGQGDKGNLEQTFSASPRLVVSASYETVSSSLTATVLETDAATGGRLLQFDLPEEVSLLQLLDVFGEVPLPPYITTTEAQSEQYQTVYAQNPGAVAAPTAGLHFTPELLEKLRQQNINQAFVTLHVGVGTFRPVEVENVTTHTMHEEWIEVPPSTVEQIRATKAAGGRIIAVGTTVVRALEGAATTGELQPFCGKTNLFIYPGYQWRVVEGMITNFHLPRSSLLMLVSALIGRQRLLNIYQEAIASRYRFYSFGDAMLILPEATI